MAKLNIEKRKKELFYLLTEVEQDISRLNKNIARAREDLQEVQTEDDARAFDKSCDLEIGLKHITLIW